MNAIDKIFERCVERGVLGKSELMIRCKLGLWGVFGFDKAQLEREARHYWIQYFQDGEYTKLLTDSHPSPPPPNI